MCCHDNKLPSSKVINLLVDEEDLVVSLVGEVEDQLVRFNLNPKPATDSVWLRPQANSVHRLVFNLNLNMILNQALNM